MDQLGVNESNISVVYNLEGYCSFLHCKYDEALEYCNKIIKLGVKVAHVLIVHILLVVISGKQ